MNPRPPRSRFPRLAASLRALTTLTALAALAQADVRVVRAGAVPPEFDTIQAAVDASSHGDTIFVTAGEYEGFATDRGISVIGEGESRSRISGTVDVHDLGSRRTVLLAGLGVEGRPDFGGASPALVVRDCGGAVRVQNTILRGASGVFDIPAPEGGRAAELTNSLDVAFSNAQVFGGAGRKELLSDARPGHDGLVLVGSAATLYDTLVRGGRAGDLGGPLPGGRALVVDGLFGVVVIGSSIVGGFGADPLALDVTVGGDGGDGLVVVAPGRAEIFDTQRFGGVPGTGMLGSGAMGASQSGDGFFNEYPGTSREVSRFPDYVLREAGVVPMQVRGEPGDRFHFPVARRAGFLYFPTFSGTWLVPTPVPMLNTPAVTLGEAGVATIEIPIPTWPRFAPGASELRWFQGYVVDTKGVAHLGTGFAVMVFDCSEDASTPGSATLCEAVGACPRTTVYVDDDGAASGTGTPADPYPSLRRALDDATCDGLTIVLEDGTYDGPDNRDLDVRAPMTIVSRSGAAGCVIDLEGLGRAFEVGTSMDFLGGPTRFEGLSVTNGSAFSGGAFFSAGSPVEIVDCDIVDCTSLLDGGAIRCLGPIRVEGTTMLRCTSQFGRGGALAISNAGAADPGGLRGVSLASCSAGVDGGGAHVVSSAAFRIQQSLFAFCSAGQHGGGLHVSQGPSVELSSFVECTAEGRGGGLRVAFLGGGTSAVRGSQFAGCAAARGGGLALDGAAGSCVPGPCTGTATIDGCTIVGNAIAGFVGGTSRGAGIHLEALDAEVRNTVFLDNVANIGFSVWSGGGGVATIGSCSTEFGVVGGAFSGTFTDAGANLFDLDPLFVDPDGFDDDPMTFVDNDYTLGAGSPCIDSGDSSFLGPDAFDLDGDGDTSERIPFDLFGQPRLVDDPAVPDTGLGRAGFLDRGASERP